MHASRSLDKVVVSPLSGSSPMTYNFPILGWYNLVTN